MGYGKKREAKTGKRPKFIGQKMFVNATTGLVWKVGGEKGQDPGRRYWFCSSQYRRGNFSTDHAMPPWTDRMCAVYCRRESCFLEPRGQAVGRRCGLGCYYDKEESHLRRSTKNLSVRILRGAELAGPLFSEQKTKEEKMKARFDGARTPHK